jgi:hypothetical protein
MEEEGAPKRVRLWEHQEGIYATSVSLPVQLTDEMRRVQETALEAAREAWGSGVTALPELHVSVTRTLPVAREARARVTRRLSAALLEAGETAFGAQSTGLAVLANETRETSFVVLLVEAAALERLVGRLDAELAALGQPVFPRPALLHVSLGWLPGDWISRQEELLARWGGREDLEDIAPLRLSECVLRVGDVDHCFALPPEEC